MLDRRDRRSQRSNRTVRRLKLHTKCAKGCTPGCTNRGHPVAQKVARQVAQRGAHQVEKGFAHQVALKVAHQAAQRVARQVAERGAQQVAARFCTPRGTEGLAHQVAQGFALDMPPKAAASAEEDEPARRRDKYEQMLYAEHLQIPAFASSWNEFVAMWDDVSYGDFDKLSIYYSVLLGTLRKVNAISEQVEHGPILLEMALVKFLSVWLKWGTDDRVEPGKFARGPSKKKDMDPTDIAMFGNNAEFLQSITAIDDDQAIEYMKAAGLSIATVTRAAALAGPGKGSKARVVDLQKVNEGLSQCVTITNSTHLTFVQCSV